MVRTGPSRSTARPRETFSRGPQTFSRGPSGNFLKIFLFKMVHFGILYISGRRWGPKRRGAGKVYSAECGNLKRCILRNFTWGTFRKLHLTSGERASRFFREKRGTCRQSLWHCDCWHNTSTLHTVNYPTWSRVINKLKFDHLLKKEEGLLWYFTWRTAVKAWSKTTKEFSSNRPTYKKVAAVAMAETSALMFY